MNDGQFVFTGNYGHVLYRIESDACHIELIEVNEDKRDQGFGTKLMNDFFNDVSICSTFQLEAYSNPEYESMSLERLVSFYTTLGFEKDEHQENTSKIYMTKIVK